MAGPSLGSRSRCRTVRPSATRITARTTTAKNRNLSSLVSGFLLMGSRSSGRSARTSVPRKWAVDAVENAAMARDQSSGVLHAEIALHRRHGDVAEEAGDAEDEAGQRRPAHIQRREVRAGKRRNERCRGDAAENPTPPATGLTTSPDTSSHAMWESVNTVIIRPEEIVPTARRKPSLRPRSTRSGGRNRNIHTGTNTMNMPYQSIAAQ